MKTFVVGYINWSDNELVLEVISAENWREAWMKHSNIPFTDDYPIPDDVETAKTACFDVDCMMSHVEVEPTYIHVA